MSVNIEKLEGLVHLAKENTDEGRRNLLREVTDLFMDNVDDINPLESQYFGDIMGTVSNDLEVAVRKQLAEELADVELAPSELIKKLAHDEIEVARPVLLNSPVLTDGDLVDVIESRGQGHMMAISVRPTLSETVTDSLVELGDDEVLASVVSNEGALISEQSMTTVVDRAKQNENLQDPLINHRNLPPELVESIVAHVSENLRNQLLVSNPEIDMDRINKILEASRKSISEDSQRQIEESDRLIDRKEKLNKLDPEFLLSLMREQKIPEFISGFARISKIDLRTSRHTVFDTDGERLAILSKAVPFTQEQFEELIVLTDFKKSRSPEDIETLTGVYRRITPEAAQRALRFYRTRKNYNKSLPKAEDS